MFASSGERGEPCGMLPASVVGFFDAAVQPHLDQMQHAPINDTARHRLEKVGMPHWKQRSDRRGVPRAIPRGRTAPTRPSSRRDHRTSPLTAAARRHPPTGVGTVPPAFERLFHRSACHSPRRTSQLFRSQSRKRAGNRQSCAALGAKAPRWRVFGHAAWAAHLEPWPRVTIGLSIS